MVLAASDREAVSLAREYGGPHKALPAPIMSPQGQVGGNERNCNGESSGAEEADEEEARNNAESEGAESQVDDERSVASMLGGHVLIELLGAPKGRDLQEDEIR